MIDGRAMSQWILRAAAWAAGVALALSTREALAQNRRYTVFNVGADLGAASLESQGYYLVNATAMMRIGDRGANFRADLWLPLRFSTDGFRLREEDYARGRDFVRIARCVRLDLGDYTMPEDRYDPTCRPYEWSDADSARTYFSARMFPLAQLSLGHETLFHNFRTSIDPDHPQLGVVANGQFGDRVVLDAILDDVTRPRILAGRAALRPMRGINVDQIDGAMAYGTAHELQAAATWVSDLFAPLETLTALGRPILDPGTGDRQFRTTPFSAVSLDAHYERVWFNAELAPDSTPQCAHLQTLAGFGAMGYADYNRFLPVASSDALHVGAELIYKRLEYFTRYDNEGNARPRRCQTTASPETDLTDTWEVRLRGEFRQLGNRYLPEYFDANYSVQSQQFALTTDARRAAGIDAPNLTKLGWLNSRPEGSVQGFQGSLQVFVPIPTAQNEAPSRLPIGLFVEDATGPVNATVSLVVGPYQMGQLIIAAQYLRRNFDGLEDLFNVGDGSLLRLFGRVFLTSRTARSARENPSTGGINDLLNGLAVDFRFDRRFFLQPDGAFGVSNDLFLTLGTNLGVVR